MQQFERRRGRDAVGGESQRRYQNFIPHRQAGGWAQCEAGRTTDMA